MTNEEMMKKIEDAIDAQEMKFTDCGENRDGSHDYEIEFSSDAGEDVVISLNTDGSAEDFAAKMREAADDFDEDEHVESLLEAKQNGFQGVPSISILVKDAESIKEYYENLATAIEKAVR